MSEGNVPPRHNDYDDRDSAARADQIPVEQSLPASAPDDWEVIPLAGMPPLGTETGTVPPPVKRSAQAVEADLQARIRDLNQCNEVLLSRIHQLEEALERSQYALQQEVERSQRMTAEEKVAAAQSHSVAELLRDLEQSNAALDRQTILAETLEAQLKTFQERSEQIEQECTYLRQHNVEKTQELKIAEDTCADLRSRLQRQQRYTLQFKAALEKCLDTSAFNHTSRSIEDESFTESTFTPPSSRDINPLVMPRSERIQPWSAGDSPVQADPQLLSLMRSHPLKGETETDSATVTPAFPAPFASPQPTSEASEAADSEAPAAPESHSVTEANHEAEQQLWQDVERVIDSTAIAAEREASPSIEPEKEAVATEEPSFTEPIPWGAPVQKEIPESNEEVAAATDDPLAVAAAEDSESIAAMPEAVPPTEPSYSRPPTVPEAYRQSAFAASIPALDAMSKPQASPSPVVHPLRPTQRKRKSLSAVELPSFPPLPKVNN